MEANESAKHKQLPQPVPQAYYTLFVFTLQLKLNIRSHLSLKQPPITDTT